MCSHYKMNFGPLTAEIGWRVWGTPANFNGFRALASLLHRRRSTEVNQTLHDVWPSHVLVYYVYTFGSSCPITAYFQVQNSLCAQLLRSPTLAALLNTASSSGRQPNFAALNSARHLYSAGRPSRWALVHSSFFFD